MRRYWRKRLWRAFCRLARGRARERGFRQPYAPKVYEGEPSVPGIILKHRGRRYISVANWDGEA
jgi:hypothetical protein